VAGATMVALAMIAANMQVVSDMGSPESRCTASAL
jgi:hypothetical protein